MKKKVLAVLLSCLVIGGVFVGCEPDSTSKEKQQQEELMKEVGDQVGMPNITNFYEKKLAKKVFELRDDSKLVTYAYTQNMDGKYVYLGKCMGYGLPYSTQYTNPERYEMNGATLPQADPNALYSSDGLSATWLVLLDEKTGEQSIVYMEEEITVTQTKLPKRLVEDWSLPSDY
ncbi:MAG: hypothetical protein ACRCVJ_18610 [Clostridium sp.]|uniref:hypothetical protein n=1 Tax=Clostridium sp. TaxID=1506 RepID=UPI003F2A10FE